MTTTVKVEAHCDQNTEVQIAVSNSNKTETFTLNDKDTFSGYVYDNMVISVREVPKQKDDK